jgi:erythromycin esterase
MRIAKINHFFIVLLLLFASCQQENNTQNKDQKLEEQIENAVKGHAILMLGESSHGIKDFYRVKSETVLHLYEVGLYDAVLFESGMLDIALAYERVNKQDDTKEYLKESIYYLSEELLPLFDTIKNTKGSQRPLLIAGVDVQSDKVDEVMQQLTRQYYGLDTLKNNLFKYGVKGDIANYNRASDVFVSRLKQANSDLEGMGEGFLLKVLRKTIAQQMILYNFKYRENIDREFSLQNELRDSLMAENFYWIKDSLLAKKNLIVWAHNGHIEKQDLSEGTEMLGELITRKYGEEVYAMGLTAYQGSAFEQYPQKDTLQFVHDEGSSIEYYLYNTYEDFPVMVATERIKRDTFKISSNTRNYGKIILQKTYDGIILLDSVTFENYVKF